MKSIRDAFFRLGWLLPTILPVAQIGGRALVNLLAAIYLFWAIAAVIRIPARIPRGALLLYVAVPIAFLLSLISAQDPIAGFKAWFKFTTHISVFYFTWVALQENPQGVRTLVRTWGGISIVVLVLLYLILPWFLLGGHFDPAHQLQEDNLPFLLPFGLFYLGGLRSVRLRVGAQLVFCAGALGYVVLSEGRAALLGLGVAIWLYGWLVMRVRARLAVAAALLVLAVGIGLGYATFFRGMEETASVSAAVDQFSSERTALWRHAVEHPPRTPLTGVGIGNLNRHNPILHVGSLVVGHLHNFVLDVWYETGFLGLIVLLGFLVYVLVSAFPRRSAWNADAFAWAGILVSSIAAILTSALLSFSYGSLPFDVYMFMLMAALLHNARGAATQTVKRP